METSLRSCAAAGSGSSDDPQFRQKRARSTFCSPQLGQLTTHRV
jgi:hypothetical protein